MPNINIKVIRECREEFNWIKNAQFNNAEKLNELVDLRNYLKETYQLSEAKREKYASLQEDITILISEIDKHWWDLFTKGKTD